MCPAPKRFAGRRAVATDALSFLVSALLTGPLPGAGPPPRRSAPPRLLHSAPGNHAVRPLGAPAGGGLATLVGLRGTVTVSAVGGALCVLWLLRSPIPAIRTLHTSDPAPARPGAAA